MPSHFQIWKSLLKDEKPTKIKRKYIRKFAEPVVVPESAIPKPIIPKDKHVNEVKRVLSRAKSTKIRPPKDLRPRDKHGRLLKKDGTPRKPRPDVKPPVQTMFGKGNKAGIGNSGGVGGPSKWRPEFVDQAKLAARAGFTDFELSELFQVSETTIYTWKVQYPAFGEALKPNKEIIDSRVEATLFQRAMGYKVHSEKIVVVDNEVVRVPIIEQYPPDATSMIYWTKNRQPEKWRERRDPIVEGDGIIKVIVENRLPLVSTLKEPIDETPSVKEDDGKDSKP